ncbi:hypothetical protein BASA60_009500 [Batrachochytrium salamandrivorans]|nr:hypothetical protein BASA60_009500 [Batrachochytrium salamandrivorans]
MGQTERDTAARTLHAHRQTTAIPGKRTGYTTVSVSIPVLGDAGDASDDAAPTTDDTVEPTDSPESDTDNNNNNNNDEEEEEEEEGELLAPLAEATAVLPEISTEDLVKLRSESLGRLQTTWDLICSKYSRSFEGESDEIDLTTGRIVVDHGFLKRSGSSAIGHALVSTLMTTSNQRDNELVAVVGENREDRENKQSDPLLAAAMTTAVGSESQVDPMTISELLYDDEAFDRILMPRSNGYRDRVAGNPMSGADEDSETDATTDSELEDMDNSLLVPLVEMMDDGMANGRDPLVHLNSHVGGLSDGSDDTVLPLTSMGGSTPSQGSLSFTSLLSSTEQMDHHTDLDPLTTPSKIMRTQPPDGRAYWSVDASLHRKHNAAGHRIDHSHSSPSARGRSLWSRAAHLPMQLEQPSLDLRMAQDDRHLWDNSVDGAGYDCSFGRYQPRSSPMGQNRALHRYSSPTHHPHHNDHYERYSPYSQLHARQSVRIGSIYTDSSIHAPP